ncbi:MAG: M23 family metallopeptidase [Bacillati bacterium ANGP1]|uniref:M23 family metallopeptidase n=1 Tax=Candidatus Segetimicrobium genomatis TaxID=2569760 RepID=A0A537J1L7_9BACT|nr:MAG: M23 family metallopeptidase [Terrabacteria group bacterium ANGP1]
MTGEPSMRTACVIALTFLVLAASVRAGPVVTLSVSPAVISQGGAVVVTVTGDLPDGTLQVRFAGRTWPLYRDSNRWRTYLGTDPNTAAGSRAIVVEIVDHDSIQILARRIITVRRVAFPRRTLIFDPETLALLTPEKVAEEQAKVAAGLRVLEPAQLWSASFRMPVAGTITSPYGVISIYQGASHGWHHGIDIAAPEGEIVRAANGGIVRLAEPLPLSGDTVILDHGMGILTFYMHMSALDVTAGERVHTGDIVGRVGSTGLATGPHLHWGVRVNGVYVDPLLWAH